MRGNAYFESQERAKMETDITIYKVSQRKADRTQNVVKGAICFLSPPRAQSKMFTRCKHTYPFTL